MGIFQRLFHLPTAKSSQKRPTPQGFGKTFILEPILTPSAGLVDDDVAIGPPPNPEIDTDIDPDGFADIPEWASLATDGFSGFEPVSFFEEGVFTVDNTGQVSVEFLYDGGSYYGEVAIFSLEGLDPEGPDFMRVAMERALSSSDLGHVVITDASDAAKFSGSLGEGDWNSGTLQPEKSVAMRPGDRFGIMLIPNGTVQQALNALNDNLNYEDKRPLFSLGTANPLDGFHVGQIADVTGDGNIFVMEDQRFDTGSDHDYNDIIFRVKGAFGQAVTMDELIEQGVMDADQDWRYSDLGQEILDYGQYFAAVDPNHPSLDLPEIDPADQPLIGIIDTGMNGTNSDLNYSNITWGSDYIDGDNDPTLASGVGNEHGTHIAGIIGAIKDNDTGIDGINDDAPLWVSRAVGSGKWADALVEFVDHARESNQPNAVVNLSMDLTQMNPDGSVTTRYEFTPMERAAIEYARQHNVLIVAAAGNDGGVMSVLGQASQEFDNIITVGAAQRISDAVSASQAFVRADYSSYGYGLDIVAPGGSVESPEVSLVGDGVGTLAGTSVATAKVTGAASQVWAANPELSYRQVIEILKATATDLQEKGWDTETGFGLLNVLAAVQLAKATQPEAYEVLPTLIPETWGGEGVVTASDRPVNNNPPTITVQNRQAVPNEVIPAANFFSVTHRDGQPIQQYRFFSPDQMPGSGYFILNGVKTSHSFSINANQLKDLQFVSGSEPGKIQTFSVRAFDGELWSSEVNAVVNPQTINGSIQGNKLPEIIVHNRAFKPGESVPLSTLFSVSDADNDAMQIYHIYDRDHSGSSGYVTLNGVRQSGSIYVNASQLKNMQFVASSEAGKIETLAIRAFDGKHWSQYRNLVANPLPINGSASTNRVPVININNVTLSPGIAIPASSLFSVQDSDGDAMQTYYFHNRDSSSNGSYFTLNGVRQSQTIYINASQLKDLQFIPGSGSTQAQSMVIAAFDGKHWSEDRVIPIRPSTLVQTPTDALNSAAQKAIEAVYQTNKDKLGQPTGKLIDLGNGFLQQNFEKGHITWNGQKAVAYFTSTGLPTTSLQMSYQTGTSIPVTLTPFSKLGTNSNITRVDFEGTVGPSIGVNLRHSPRFADRSSRNEPRGRILKFDAWTYGETGIDMWTGRPDNRWFKIKNENLWVPSCWIWGNPPSSNNGGSGTLAELDKKSRLTIGEIRQYRQLVAQLPQSQRPAWYRKLQYKVPYFNQRDNGYTSIADVMCNLTSLASCLTYLGVKNPTPSKQFEDVLETILRNNPTKYPSTDKINARYWWSNLSKLATSEFGVKSSGTKSFPGFPSTDTNFFKNFVKNNWQPALDQGKAIMAGVSNTSAGHIVKILDIDWNRGGIIVDDPFGKANTSASKGYSQLNTKSRGSVSTQSGQDEGGVGNDNFWSWSYCAKVFGATWYLILG